MNKPIEKMTVRPYGGDILAPAFLSLVKYAFGDKDHRSQFKKETGMDIQNVVYSHGINQLIDEQTGYQEAVLAKWCDWVAINLWGIE